MSLVDSLDKGGLELNETFLPRLKSHERIFHSSFCSEHPHFNSVPYTRITPGELLPLWRKGSLHSCVTNAELDPPNVGPLAFGVLGDIYPVLQAVEGLEPLVDQSSYTDCKELLKKLVTLGVVAPRLEGKLPHYQVFTPAQLGLALGFNSEKISLDAIISKLVECHAEALIEDLSLPFEETQGSLFARNNFRLEKEAYDSSSVFVTLDRVAGFRMVTQDLDAKIRAKKNLSFQEVFDQAVEEQVDYILLQAAFQARKTPGLFRSLIELSVLPPAVAAHFSLTPSSFQVELIIPEVLTKEEIANFGALVAIFDQKRAAATSEVPVFADSLIKAFQAQSALR